MSPTLIDIVVIARQLGSSIKHNRPALSSFRPAQDSAPDVPYPDINLES